MTWQGVTALVVVGLVVGLVLYDLTVYAVGGDGPTISRTVLSVADQYRGFAVCFTFSLGVLCGHLFLPQHVSK